MKGLRPGEGCRLRLALEGGGAALDCGRAGRATPTASTRRLGGRGFGTDSRAPRARGGRGVDGHDHRGRHRLSTTWRPGDEVAILGAQGDEPWQRIDAREMAAAIGTIPWEIVCRLGTRVERQYS